MTTKKETLRIPETEREGHSWTTDNLQRNEEFKQRLNRATTGNQFSE